MYLSNDAGVDLLEHFVQAELAKTLEGVAEERGRPALAQLPNTALAHCHLEALENAAVLLRVYLHGSCHVISLSTICLLLVALYAALYTHTHTHNSLNQSQGSNNRLCLNFTLKSM